MATKRSETAPTSEPIAVKAVSVEALDALDTVRSMIDCLTLATTGLGDEDGAALWAVLDVAGKRLDDAIRLLGGGEPE